MRHHINITILRFNYQDGWKKIKIKQREIIFIDIIISTLHGAIEFILEEKNHG